MTSCAMGGNRELGADRGRPYPVVLKPGIRGRDPGIHYLLSCNAASGWQPRRIERPGAPMKGSAACVAGPRRIQPGFQRTVNDGFRKSGVGRLRGAPVGTSLSMHGSWVPAKKRSEAQRILLIMTTKFRYDEMATCKATR